MKKNRIWLCVLCLVCVDEGNWWASCLIFFPTPGLILTCQACNWLTTRLKTHFKIYTHTHTHARELTQTRHWSISTVAWSFSNPPKSPASDMLLGFSEMFEFKIWDFCLFLLCKQLFSILSSVCPDIWIRFFSIKPRVLSESLLKNSFILYLNNNRPFWTRVQRLLSCLWSRLAWISISHAVFDNMACSPNSSGAELGWYMCECLYGIKRKDVGW